MFRTSWDAAWALHVGDFMKGDLTQKTLRHDYPVLGEW